MKQLECQDRLRSSVIAVPPLARTAALEVDRVENGRMIRYLQSGGVRTLLYGGNAVFYHLRPSEYEATVRMLIEESGPDTWVIPSIGPSFGLMLDHAEIVARLPLETAMVLPQREIADAAGIVEGIRRAVDVMGKPIVLYLKFDRWLPPDDIAKLVDEGRVSWIKYAVVREEPSQDPYLDELLHVVAPEMMVSGMGEQPAIVHMRDFGMAGFTSGCVCVQPHLATQLLRCAAVGDWDGAEAVRQRFETLEDLRNEISPIRVLHRAVGCSGVLDPGPILPLLGELQAHEVARIAEAVRALMGS